MRLATVCLACFACLASAPALSAAEVALDSDQDKLLYTLGLAISQNLAPFAFTEQELSVVQAGLVDGALGRAPRTSLEEFGPKIDGMLRERLEAVGGREREAGQAFRSKAAGESGAVTTASGLIYRELQAGSGASPESSDTVKLSYRGTLRDGSVFDRSEEGKPATFRLGGVIPCFSEGVQKMKVGGKSKLTCPPELAYGDRGSPPKIRPGATLVFEVELLDIVPQDPSPPPTSDLP